MQRRIKEYQSDPGIYVLGLDERAKKKSVWVSLGFMLGIAVLQILAGMLNPPSSRTFWIVYPYLAIFLPMMYGFWGVFTYRKATCRMSSTQYHEGLLRIRRSMLAVMVLAAIGIVLELLYLGLHHAEVDTTAKLIAEVLYIALHIMLILCVVIYGKYYDKMLTNITVEK